MTRRKRRRILATLSAVVRSFTAMVEALALSGRTEVFRRAALAAILTSSSVQAWI